MKLPYHSGSLKQDLQSSSVPVLVTCGETFQLSVPSRPSNHCLGFPDHSDSFQDQHPLHLPRAALYRSWLSPVLLNFLFAQIHFSNFPLVMGRFTGCVREPNQASLKYGGNRASGSAIPQTLTSKLPRSLVSKPSSWVSVGRSVAPLTLPFFLCRLPLGPCLSALRSLHRRHSGQLDSFRSNHPNTDSFLFLLHVFESILC